MSELSVYCNAEIANRIRPVARLFFKGSNVRSLSEIRESASDPCYLLGFFSICDGFEQSGKDHEMRHQQQRHD